MAKDEPLQYEIKDVYEEGGNINVLVETVYGTKKLGFSMETKKLDPRTDEPRYISQVEKHLELLYGNKNRKKQSLSSDFIGKKRTMETIKVPGGHQ